MRLLHGGVDITVIALWLDLALARTAPPKTRTGRYRPPDQLLAFLESL